jgi:hypothetical protein
MNRLDLYKIPMSSNLFGMLSLRFKADDDAALTKEPLMDSVTVHEAVEAPPAAVAQDSSSKTEEQISISTGMS